MVWFFYELYREKYSGITKYKGKIMEFIDKRFVVPPWTFKTDLILSGIDFLIWSNILYQSGFFFPKW